MTKRITLIVLAAVAMCCFAVSAEPVKIKGVYNTNRYDDHADHWYSTYVGWNSTLGKTIFVVENGIYLMEVDGNTLSTPVKDPAVNISDFYSGGQFTDDEKALWANNFNLMYGNSGAVMVNNVITTVTSRTDGDDVDDTNRFAVRKWDATTGELLNSPNQYYPTSACLESAGMCLNPVDGQVYGLFYLTAQDLPEEITSDPDFFVDQDGDATSTDAGYCICTIDLETMTITPITPGLYYGNFVTFAINSEGRAFAMTSGGTAGVEGDDGKMYDINGNLTGAALHEFDLSTGLMITRPETFTDPETGEEYTEEVNIYPATGYCSQVKRQSACFSMSDPNKMYWNGYYNSGKGYNQYGNWGPLPDRDWKTNGKYDTALYEVDVTTGEATRIAKIDNRFVFSCMWVVEDENPYLRGDVNGDGVVSGADVTALYSLLLDGIVPKGQPDVNEDGIVSGSDVTSLYSILLGE